MGAAAVTGAAAAADAEGNVADEDAVHAPAGEHEAADTPDDAAAVAEQNAAGLGIPHVRRAPRAAWYLFVGVVVVVGIAPPVPAAASSHTHDTPHVGAGMRGEGLEGKGYGEVRPWLHAEAAGGILGWRVKDDPTQNWISSRGRR